MGMTHLLRFERRRELRRTTKQIVFDLLDREGDLSPRLIAERLGITDGCAHGNKHRWKKARGHDVGTRQNPVFFLRRIPAGEDGYVPPSRPLRPGRGEV